MNNNLNRTRKVSTWRNWQKQPKFKPSTECKSQVLQLELPRSVAMCPTQMSAGSELWDWVDY